MKAISVRQPWAHCLLGTVRLLRAWSIEPLERAAARLTPWADGRDDGRIVELAIGQHAGFGDRDYWRQSRFAWELDEPIRYAEPRPARGRQGMFRVTGEYC